MQIKLQKKHFQPVPDTYSPRTCALVRSMVPEEGNRPHSSHPPSVSKKSRFPATATTP